MKNSGPKPAQVWDPCSHQEDHSTTTVTNKKRVDESTRVTADTNSRLTSTRRDQTPRAYRATTAPGKTPAPDSRELFLASQFSPPFPCQLSTCWSERVTRTSPTRTSHGG